MMLDTAASASQPELAEAASRMARYSAKDKAVARAHANDPLAALTDERKQWIENKRKEAVQRATKKRMQLEQPNPVSTGSTATSEWAARLRASYAHKKARLDTTPAVDPDAGVNKSGNTSSPAGHDGTDTSRGWGHQSDLGSGSEFSECLKLKAGPTTCDVDAAAPVQ